MSEATEREAICAIGQSIFARGLTAGSSGNISVRTDSGWLMTPTNASLGRLDPAATPPRIPEQTDSPHEPRMGAGVDCAKRLVF